MSTLSKWLSSTWSAAEVSGGAQDTPAEAVALRWFGLLVLVASIVVTFTTKPHPGLHGQGVVVLMGLVLFAVSAIASAPPRPDMPAWRVIPALAGITAGSVLLAIGQPKGIWTVGVYVVAIVAASRLELLPATLVTTASLVPFLIGMAADGHAGSGAELLFGVIPWFLVMRLVRAVHAQRDQLEASRVAEAQAAAAAERGRLAREMHDVLAHSLSALALQLETTRLLARDHGVDEQIANTIDKAHHLAASGLQEARRAIATARGDELPGPERLGALADVFGEQSGLPVQVEVRGEPRELAPQARLALYRTAQEALTNVRRHATAARVEVKLDYLPAGTVLVVEDHSVVGAPPPAALGVNGRGYGLTGMRERAELLGGELLAAPTPAGFRVELRLPT